jgi:small subunit ribosomal protein S3Ae
MSDMAKKMSAKARAAARKQKDKWKTKRWYTIRAPRSPWNFQNIGETIGESDEHIMGRVYEMTQQEFNGDFTKMHVMLRFRVTDTAGQDALTTFVGHHHQTNHIRRQIRRYRGKIDDVMDSVTEDGYLVRIKPLIITQKRVQTSVKQAIRSKTREVVRGFIAKSTYDGLQVAMLDGSLESNIQNSIKSIYPCKSVVIRKSQLLQAGVVMDAGPTLDEIHAQEARSAAELKAKKAAALAEAMEDEDSEEAEEETTEEVAEAPAEVAEAPEPVAEEPAAEEVVEEAPAEASTDYSSMTVAQLKELLKEAGKPVSGKKAELIERLQE